MEINAKEAAHIIKKQSNKISDSDELHQYSKEELIEKIKSLQSHNMQLRNIIAKSSSKQMGKQCKKVQKPFDFTTCTFRHVLLKFMYIGWDYQGYAVQEDTTNTIENYLFEALIKTCLIKNRNSSNYHRCGRTDKGVSSFGQVISIDLRSRLSKDQQDDINSEINYCNTLNKVLPENIQCIAWCPVDDDFSARFNCKSRTYKYFFPRDNLNIENMQIAAQYLIGTHDFRNFCKMDVGNGVIQFVRNILSIELSPSTRVCDKEDYNLYVATIKGQAFLWHQIRCIMGVLLLIGQGKEEPEIVKELLNIEKNPRKPDYNMASEVPLNLYYCEYDSSREWIYDYTSLSTVIQKLKTQWTFSSIKSTMIEYMLHDVEAIHNSLKSNKIEKPNNINYLLSGVKSKNYIPLMKRQKCESLEDRIEHYVKKKKLEISEEAIKSSN
ncbi:hypothetical protein ILUMI_22071 [Ignelater luminosus]|uniref:Pseudouridine synthase I TruA alpha/beta domain-containing protein n=1 Tax=Ignelater luminosus TaxID=2038154 RepID=A0A8K0CGH7_IGNLU|nr:hypothetical protein ILUMI_22071 [Ignelater luminosus]